MSQRPVHPEGKAPLARPPAPGLLRAVTLGPFLCHFTLPVPWCQEAVECGGHRSPPHNMGLGQVT